MQEKYTIFLPGGFKQLRILKSKFSLKDKTVLVIGAGSQGIAEKIFNAGAAKVRMILDDFDSLMSSRISLSKESPIKVEMMEFDNTDFTNNEFDLVYAQGSISASHRNKIIKEIKRILKPGGILCVGEITALTKNYPTFIKDIFESSNISALLHDECSAFYEARDFYVIYEQDLSSSLKSFYENAKLDLSSAIDDLTEQEESYYKKLLNKISHESNAYLNLGADKYIGFKMLIMKPSVSAP